MIISPVAEAVPLVTITVYVPVVKLEISCVVEEYVPGPVHA